jgi:hypothetical protein
MRRLVMVLVVALGLARSAIAAPRLELAAHTPQLTAYAEPGLEDTARELAGTAAAALAEIADDLRGLPTPPHVELRVVLDAADLAAVAPAGRGAPSYAVGVAYLGDGVITLALRRGSVITDPTMTLRHELAHIALAAALGPRAPHWLHEGFAYQHAPEWSPDRIETLATMAWLDSTIPLEELDRAFPAAELPAHRAYAESYDFVAYLAQRGRWADRDDDGDRSAFRRFLNKLAHGATLDEAARHAFGVSTRALFDEWKVDFEDRYKFAPIGLIGFVLWTACALLLVLAWRRRRRQNKVRLARWADEEAARRAAHSQQVVAPPYVPWPGEDPFDEPEDASDDDHKLLN